MDKNYQSNHAQISSYMVICLTPENYDKIKHHYNYSNYQETHFGCKHIEPHFVGLLELELGTFKSREPD